jgi:hypothetical protein
MTEPQPDALTVARRALHAGVVAILERADWPAERAHEGLPRQMVSPAGWVDVPTLTPSTEPSGVRTVLATFPVLFTTDGLESSQAVAQDVLLAHGWDVLSAVRLPGVERSAVSVATAAPAMIDVAGVEARGVNFTVQVRLLARTLCPATIVPDTQT